MGTMEADRGRPLAIIMAYKYHELCLISIKARWIVCWAGVVGGETVASYSGFWYCEFFGDPCAAGT